MILPVDWLFLSSNVQTTTILNLLNDSFTLGTVSQLVALRTKKYNELDSHVNVRAPASTTFRLY
ncbi:Uncharacterized protein APZ42_015826 [Daphnia magna]|uniref:Uncharacterized protein n=1 Tax=Daphnia magna TaxID=35525 RepID=A0A162NBM5_9CRUS|nr:Uncharacterized protein APZ42_015826 [Daphnia magna]